MRWLNDWFGPELARSVRLRRAGLMLLLLAACAYRVWLIIAFNPMGEIYSDPGRHWAFGTHPLGTEPLLAMDPIGYQIYIGMLAKLTAGSPVLVAYWTALLSLSGPWLWYRFLRELLPGRDWALAGWVILAALPSWSAIYSYFMQETLLLPLLGAALWATWRCRRKRDLASFVVATLAWMLAGLTRGICIPLAAVAMTWLWFEQSGKPVKAAMAVLLLGAVLAPLAGRSWYLVRLISPHGVGNMVQLYALAGTQDVTVEFTRRQGREYWNYGFVSPAVLEPPFAPLSDWRTWRHGTLRFAVDLDAGRRDWDAASSSLQPWDLRRAALLTSDNLIHLFCSESWPDTNKARAIGKVNYWLRWIWVPLALICVVLTIVRWRTRRDALLLALIATWFVVQGLLPISVNEGRYRKPFEGLLVAQCLLLASGRRSQPLRAVVDVVRE